MIQRPANVEELVAGFVGRSAAGYEVLGACDSDLRDDSAGESGVAPKETPAESLEMGEVDGSASTDGATVLYFRGVESVEATESGDDDDVESQHSSEQASEESEGDDGSAGARKSPTDSVKTGRKRGKRSRRERELEAVMSGQSPQSYLFDQHRRRW